jgi:TRAP-type mannitol/chloroaromatic compound transport system permease small subunit
MEQPAMLRVMARGASTRINWVTGLIGRLSAWLVVALVFLTLYDVMMRYLFQTGSVALQELEWHLFGLIILLGACFTLQEGNHVRVDLIYSSARLSDQSRRLIDITGTLLFLLPFSALIIWTSIPFAHDAFIHHEMSPDPGGLGYRWILKAAIPLGFALLALQGTAQALTAFCELFDDE